MKCLATRELRVVLEFHVTNEAPFNLRVWDLGRVFFFDSSSMKVHLELTIVRHDATLFFISENEKIRVVPGGRTSNGPSHDF